MIPFTRIAFPAVLVAASLAGVRAQAQETVGGFEDLAARNHELSRRIDALAAELERMQVGETGADVDPPRGLGLAPGAMGVFRVDQGLSIGGYGEAVFDQNSNGTDKADFLRAILYAGYKFNDRWVFNSEIEFEHASTGQSGSASVEFATLDHLRSPGFNLRTGLMLVPMGIVNEIHEPTAFAGAHRPETERRIMPSTWRENGIGIFGEAGPFDYRAYLVNGLDASGFSAGGLRGGRQKGSKALAEDLAIVARADYVDTPGLVIGGSVYVGDSGQDQYDGGVGTTIAEVHGIYEWNGFELRALYAQADVDDADLLNATLDADDDDFDPLTDSVGERLEGGYVQLGYDVMRHLAPDSRASLTPFVRLETIDTQVEVPAGFGNDASTDETITTIGIDYKPIDNIVFKLTFADYDEGDDKTSLSMGYVF
ncbi:MAG: hypothetical protein QF903_02635 [Planctomycetota bacterium]|jgi:hypothetical protein|nr:hypothetical protein [Planctomycetota bacterium]MDP6763977.1 hypothetical protein [Planctomycetota bacterium]MDP6988358.1 hypothetical protein [Planctomycetota bacterium]